MGMGAQEGPKVLGWLQVSYSGLWGSQGSWTLSSECSSRALKVALGSHSVWIWGFRWLWGLTMAYGDLRAAGC